MIDASVAAKWVVAEAHSEQAALLLDWGTLYAPAHWLAEAVNALWGKVLRGELAAPDGRERAAALVDAPIIAVPLHGLMPESLALSIACEITIYDSLYVALARARGVPFVTADRKLVRKLELRSMKAESILWIGDL